MKSKTVHSKIDGVVYDALKRWAAEENRTLSSLIAWGLAKLISERKDA